MTAGTDHDSVDDAPEDDGLQEATRGKKRPRDADDEPQPSAIRIRLNLGTAGSVNYVVKTKEPNVPLPDPFDGNPRHLKEFLTDLDLCFRASPSKYATDNVKVMVAGRLCSNRKVSPWRNTWLQRWKQHEEGYKSWEDFERGMRSEFGDHLEKKDACTKFKRIKQTGKLREYISLMQSLNLEAGYTEEIEWEIIYDSLKPKMKKMWAVLDNPLEDLRDKYAKLVKLGAVAEDIEADQKRNGTNESGEKRAKKARKEKKSSGEGKPKTDAMVSKEQWEQRRKADLCYKCGSDKHKIRDCKSEASTKAKVKEESGNSKGKGPEKKIAAVDVGQSEPEKQDEEHVSAAAHVGKIFESDDDILDWGDD